MKKAENKLGLTLDRIMDAYSKKVAEKNDATPRRNDNMYLNGIEMADALGIEIDDIFLVAKFIETKKNKMTNLLQLDNGLFVSPMAFF